MNATELSKRLFLALSLLCLTTLAQASESTGPLQKFLNKILPFNWEGVATYYSPEGNIVEKGALYYSIGEDAPGSYTEWVEYDSNPSGVELFAFKLEKNNGKQTMVLGKELEALGAQLKVHNLTEDFVDYEILHPDPELPLTAKVQQYFVSAKGPMIRIEQVLINGKLTATRITKLHIATGEQ